MIIVPIKEGENIEKALKKFKRKFEKTGVVRELRSRKQFEKPSVKRRNEIKKAIYVQHLRLNEEYFHTAFQIHTSYRQNPFRFCRFFYAR